MKLYIGNKNYSSWSMRSWVLLTQAGIPFDEVMLRFDAFTPDSNFKAALRDVSPTGKVPVLVDGDFVIWESRAINSYLASKKPERGLYPDDPKARATVDQWLYWQTIHLGPAMQKLSFERFLKSKFGMGDPDQSVIDTELKNVDQFLAVLEIGLAGKDWIAGDLSVADFTLATTFMYRAQSDISLDDLPNVAGWIERLEARQSWKDAFAPVLALLGG